jgi:hypothetical protein
MLKRAVMTAGAQMNGFPSSAQRPSVCQRGLDGSAFGLPVAGLCSRGSEVRARLAIPRVGHGAND